MNSEEFDNWIKEKIDSTPFSGHEEGWKELESKISPIRKRKTRFFMPMKIAAGILVPLLTYWGYHFLNSENNKNVTTEFVSSQVKDEVKPLDTTSQMQKVHPVIFSSDKLISDIKPTPKINLESRELATDTSSNIKLLHHNQIENTEQEYTQKEPEQHKTFEYKVDPNDYKPDRILPLDNDGFDVDYALYVGVGSQNVSPLQYQVGVSGQMDLGNKFSLDASIGFRSSQVHMSENNHFNGLHAESLPGTSSTPNYLPTETEVRTVYNSNIYSIGINPRLNYRITPHIQLSAGVYSYKNLNTQISLQDSDNTSMELAENGIIHRNYNVNPWDVGVTTGVNFKINSKLKVDVQYIRGLNKYIETLHTQVSSNGIQIGMKYNLKK